MSDIVQCITLVHKDIIINLYADLGNAYIHIGKDCYIRKLSEIMEYIKVGLKEDLQRIDEANTQILE